LLGARVGSAAIVRAVVSSSPTANTSAMVIVDEPRRRVRVATELISGESNRAIGATGWRLWLGSRQGALAAETLTRA
jgi:hypothetical protein